MIIGDRLRKLREEKNLTQTELGSIIGVKKSAISSYEHEKRMPNSETIISLMQVFSVSADYLIGADHLIKTVSKDKEITTLTKEELIFLRELKKNKYIYDILLEEPKRIAELIKSRIG